MKRLLPFLTLLLSFFGANSQGSWVQKTNFPGAVRYSAASCAIGDKIYVGLGSNGGVTIYSDWWEYDPANDTWAQKQNFGGGTRYLATCMAINGKAYAGLGVSGSLKKDW